MNSMQVPLKASRLEPLLRPLQAFLAAESAGGILLMVAAVFALVCANSPWASRYHAFWHFEITVGAGGAPVVMSLQHMVNDGLMAVFFLLVGLEIKRELLLGELASLRRAALPLAAAIGGMVVPGLVYAAFNSRGPGAGGWGIPMATDIAFAVGILALVGRSLPTSVKVFLLAIAIVDDLGAVVIIALFFTKSISLGALGIAGGCFALLIVLNLLGVHRPLPYILVGIGLWVATLYSGIHATVAGVLLAFTIPATRQIQEVPYIEFMRRMLLSFEGEAATTPSQITENQSHALLAMGVASNAVQTPLTQVEHALLKPVAFFIVPLFALANAGVELRGGIASFSDPIAIGVMLGLLVGKPLGILAASWLAIKGGIATLPLGATWVQVVGVSVLCGIGFTMSLFVGDLAFGTALEMLLVAKIGILTASVLAGVVGGGILFVNGRSRE